jgi:hypothetical protein
MSPAATSETSFTIPHSLEVAKLSVQLPSVPRPSCIHITVLDSSVKVTISPATAVAASQVGAPTCQWQRHRVSKGDGDMYKCDELQSVIMR